MRYKGKIIWNANMPNGTPRKLLDISKTRKMDWHNKISLKEGLAITYKDFLSGNGRNKR